jgi:cation diffusion facilitator CzcD-associated flavoprotein CzcO
MKPEDLRLAELAQRIHHESEMLAYPTGDWIDPLVDDTGRPVYEIVIIGGGQCGLGVAQGLIRDGIRNILVLDRNPEGFEGPWRTYARMAVLRTPKFQVGLDHGIPSLTTRAWYEAKYGAEAWAALERVGREDWMDYLRWYRKVLNLPVRNGVDVTDIRPAGRWFEVAARTQDGAETIRGRRIVLTTGFDGNGEWRIPEEIAASLPPELCKHSNTMIDFTQYRGKRIGILGHGASAFDAAIAAAQHGAATVDLCFRRPVPPIVNPYRGVEYPGFLKDFCELDDRVRWSLNYYFDVADQPPARHSFDTAQTFANFAMHPASPWLSVGMDGGEIRIATPQRNFAFDHVICATGSMPDLAARQELRSFAGEIALWRDRFTPPPEEQREILGLYPYLGDHYELLEREPGAAPFLKHIYAFNFSAIISMGPHSTSISGHKYSIPRVIRGITRSLFLEQQDGVVAKIRSFQVPEIDWPADKQRSAAE